MLKAVLGSRMPVWVVLLVFLAVLLTGVMCVQHAQDLWSGSSGRIWQRLGLNKILAIPEIVAVASSVPPRVVDHWYERVIYREVDPDTVEIIRYPETPVTVDLVQAEIKEDGRVRIEVLVNATESRVLEGHLAGAGDTHIVVNPEDTTVTFVSNRFGFDAAWTAGLSTCGSMTSLETFYINGIPLLGTLHGPNPTLGYNAGDELGWLGIGASVDVAPFRTPARLGGGARVSFDDLENFSLPKVGVFGSLTFSLWDF